VKFDSVEVFSFFKTMRDEYGDFREETRTQLRDKIEAFLAEEAGIDSIPIQNFKQVSQSAQICVMSLFFLNSTSPVARNLV
jgi:hypothetical protein